MVVEYRGERRAVDGTIDSDRSDDPAPVANISIPTQPEGLVPVVAPTPSDNGVSVSLAIPPSTTPLSTFIVHTAPRLRGIQAQRLAAAGSGTAIVSPTTPATPRRARHHPIAGGADGFFTRVNRL